MYKPPTSDETGSKNGKLGTAYDEMGNGNHKIGKFGIRTRAKDGMYKYRRTADSPKDLAMGLTRRRGARYLPLPESEASSTVGGHILWRRWVRHGEFGYHLDIMINLKGKLPHGIQAKACFLLSATSNARAPAPSAPSHPANESSPATHTSSLG